LESLFKYLATIGLYDGIKYFSLLCLVLSILPYYETIVKYIRQIIMRDNLRIISFKCSTSPFVFDGYNSGGKPIFTASNPQNILINNAVLNFTWEVKGALKVDFLPIKKKVKGNAASVIINQNTKKYTLVAHGFTGKKIEAVIDFSNQVVHHIKTEEFSANQTIIRLAPNIQNNKFHRTPVLNFKQTKTKISHLKNWLRSNVKPIKSHSINTEFVVHTNNRRSKIDKRIEAASILKVYTFSTKKYQSLK